MSRDILENYPIRYIDLCSKVSICDAHYGDFCTLVANVYEVKRGDHTTITLVDGTGVILLDFFYNNNSLESIKAGDRLAIAGNVVDFASYKRMLNPLFKKDFDDKCEVVAIYRNDDIKASILKNASKMTKAQKAIHGFSSKEELLKARRDIKRQQIEKFATQIKSRDVISYLLNISPKIAQQKEIVDTRIVTKDDFGDVCEEIRDSAQRNFSVLVICPLVYMTSQKRDELCKSYFQNCVYLEREYHPNISIEDGDVLKNFNWQGVSKRRQFYESILPDNHDNLQVLSSIENIDRRDVEGDTLLVIEDGDRLSTLFIDTLRKQVGGKCIVVSNSNRHEALSRLNFLIENYDRHEILLNELKCRRDGDILGNRARHTELLSLVNVARDIELFRASC